MDFSRDFFESHSKAIELFILSVFHRAKYCDFKSEIYETYHYRKNPWRDRSGCVSWSSESADVGSDIVTLTSI